MTGRIFTSPAAGFQQGVLGTSVKGKTTIIRPTGTNTTQPIPTRAPTNQTTGNTQSWFSQVTSFFGSFWGK